MIRRLRAALGGLFGRDGDAERGDGGFAFSLLDASVQYSHGQDGGHAAVRELQRANERADELESARRRDR